MPILMGEQFKQVLEANRVGAEDRAPDLNIDPAFDPETGERDEELAKWSDVLRELSEKKSRVTP
jgi:hypothetical protein